MQQFAATGASPNAFTSYAMTAYYFDCTDRFEENLRLLLHFVTTPYFTQESVEKERSIIAQEIRMYEDSAGSACFEQLAQAPQADKARHIVEVAEPHIDCAIAAIQAGQAFAPPRRNLYDRFMSGPVNPIFYACCVKARAFSASNACIHCGQCAQRCPTNNITLQDGKPVWSDTCTHCMACICYCPTEAIEYGQKSRGKPRYHYEAL